jgi:alpha-tubulin suppressor-like RCC1 family protein
MYLRPVLLTMAVVAASALLAHSAPPASADTAAAVAGGGDHTCAITSAGGLKCWGYNGYGQLGDGTTIDRSTPVDVTGLGTGVVGVAAGDRHTCALSSSGGLKCWGDNYYGQLGDGTTIDRGAPVDVAGLTGGVVAVTAGREHTCVLTDAGGVKCWGSNWFRQLGDGTTTSRSTPVDVVGLTSGVVAVAAGGSHTCALTGAGGVKCWGDNVYGQLGDGTTTSRYTPVDVTGLTAGVATVAAGANHTCAIAGESLKCWGNNDYGQVGDGTTARRFSPVDVIDFTTGAAGVAAGYRHTCALTTAGGLKCWGDNYNGQLGDGTTTSRSVPADVTGLAAGADIVASGYNHACALTSAGGLKCWGDNAVGQLGNGITTARRYTPVDVTGLTEGVAAAAAGHYHTCAITSAGGLKCWGENWRWGQVGDGTTTNRYAPVDVTGLTEGVAAVAPGNGHTCALIAGGGLKCWGWNLFGQLGDGTETDRYTPVDVTGLGVGMAAVVTGGHHSCALTSVGGVKCWGDTTETPMDVPGLTSGVVALAAGSDHNCALTTAGGLKCWGGNHQGQLGDGTTTDRNAPVDVTGLTAGVAAVATGSNHTCALTTAGGLKCWGRNDFGQLGDGTTTNRSTPVDVTGLTAGVTAVAAGYFHTCAITNAGGLKCWGWNLSGQLGDGTTTSRSTPVDVTGLTAGVVALAGGGEHTCALTTAGGLKCWGSNRFGQLGDGAGWIAGWVPVDVVGFEGAAPPVGGTVELRRDPSVVSRQGSGTGAPPYMDLAGPALALLVLTIGAWYARRRWLHRKA